MPELVLKLGDEVIEKFVFDKDIVSIGRARDNDVVVENLSVSRNHARIRRQGGKFILTDLNSANGTYVNGVKITKTEIVDSDVVSVGKHKILFVNRPVSDDDLIVEALGTDRTMVVDRAVTGMLCVTEGKLKGKEFPLTKFETTVGKASANDIVLSDDWFLSKKQAVIVRRDNRFEIRDLGGFRKTKVNGTPLNEAVELKPGDVIEFGNTRCMFQLGGENASIPAGARIPREMGLEDSVYASVSDFNEQMELLARKPERPEPPRRQLTPTEQVAPENNPNSAKADEAPATPDSADERAESPTPAAVKPSAPEAGGGGKRRKREKEREPKPDYTTQSFATEEKPAADLPPAALPSDMLPALEIPGIDGAAKPEDEAPPVERPESAPEAVPVAVAAAKPTGDLEKEIALWEAALQNRSPVIRKQAAAMLKKITGKDHAN